MVSKAQERITIGKRIKDFDDQDTIFYGLIRNKVLSPNTIAVPLQGQGSAAGSNSTDFIAKAGDSMIGPFAFFTSGTTISAGVIDVGIGTGGFSSRLIVNGEGIANDDLDTINNNTFPGQLLNIQAGAAQVITLKHLTGNIRLGTGGDLALSSGANIWLVFDATNNQWTNIGVPSDSSVAGGNFATRELNNLLVTAVNVSIFPGVTNTIDLGEDSTPLRFRNIFSHEFDIFDFGTFNERVGDPATVANEVQLYSKDKGGVSNLYFQNDAGTVFDISLSSGAGFATIELDNLGVTAINSDLDPATDGDLDLGIASASWSDLNIDRIIFRHNDGILDSFPSIGRSSNALRLNSPTGNATTIEHNGIPVISIGENSGQRIDISELSSGLRWLSGVGNFLSIIKTGSSPALFSSPDGFQFFLGDVEFGIGGILIANNGDADFNAHEITDIGNITMSADGDILNARNIEAKQFQFVNDPTVVFLEMSSAGHEFNMDGADFWTIKAGGVPIVQVVAGGTTFFEPVIVNGNLTISGVADAFLDMSDIPVPSDPFSGVTRIFHDSVDGVLKVKKFGGSVVSLEAGGGGENQTPILTNINYAQFDIENIKFIKGRDTGAVGSFRIIFDANEDSDTWIGDDSSTDSFIGVANGLTVWITTPSAFELIQPINMNQQFIQFDERSSDPSIPPATEGRVFLRESTGELSIRKANGDIISLEQGGAGGGADTDLGNLVPTAINESLIPEFNNQIDLGSPSLQFRSGFFDGVVQTDSLQVDAGATFLGPVVFDGSPVDFNGTIFRVNSISMFLGDTSNDNLTIRARINSSLIPDDDNEHDLGLVNDPIAPFTDLKWRNLHLGGFIRIDTGINSTIVDAFRITTPQVFTDNVVWTGDLRQQSGGNPKVGFFGASVVSQQSVIGPPGPLPGGANYTPSIQSIILLLQRYGLA